MANAEKQDRGLMRVDVDECKGCGLCVDACPPKLIALSERLNHYGYRTAVYEGVGCSACGICFMVCPEPGAITVLRIARHSVDKAPSIARVIVGGSECASN
ncbi:MAG: 4Fe-4S dicluster domain-containing protein [Terracidiphilus sp.]|jgi:NAD-dependent dihydropyrimidine dehydrogenase PreA subunit